MVTKYNLENTIGAKNRSIAEVLNSKKYAVDYYQREFSWHQKHIEQLVTDLATAFLNEYQPEHERFEVENYKIELKYSLTSFYVVLDGISLEVDQSNNKFLNKILEKIINEQYG